MVYLLQLKGEGEKKSRGKVEAGPPRSGNGKPQKGEVKIVYSEWCKFYSERMQQKEIVF